MESKITAIDYLDLASDEEAINPWTDPDLVSWASGDRTYLNLLARQRLQELRAGDYPTDPSVRKDLRYAYNAVRAYENYLQTIEEQG